MKHKITFYLEKRIIKALKKYAVENDRRFSDVVADLIKSGLALKS